MFCLARAKDRGNAWTRGHPSAALCVKPNIGLDVGNPALCMKSLYEDCSCWIKDLGFRPGVSSLILETSVIA